MSDYDFLFKILIIGDASVGKSSVMFRFTDNIFMDDQKSTIGVDYKIKSLRLQVENGEEKVVKYHIWDTAGQEKFKTIVRTYFQGAQGVILVFDLTNRDSFQNIRSWIQELENNGAADVPKILVGNKADLEHAVGEAEIKQMADELDMGYCETSALNGQGIQELFVRFGQQIVSAGIGQQRQPQKEVVQIKEVQQQKKGCC